MAAILPNDDKVSFGNISLLAGLLAISLRASTCLSAITLSSVPELIIAWLTFIIASASALAICSIALAFDSWKEGMIQEIREDRLCGFIGKTVIHPSQIPVVNRAYQVSRNDYLDARAILNWNADSASLVAGSKTRERMNEYKTHLNWAEKTVYLSEVFGITE